MAMPGRRPTQYCIATPPPPMAHSCYHNTDKRMDGIPAPGFDAPVAGPAARRLISRLNPATAARVFRHCIVLSAALPGVLI